MLDPRTRPRDLPAALRALNTHLDVPPPPDIAGRVHVALEDAEASRPTALRHRRAAHVALAGAIVALLAAALVVASPSARHAVADWLGVLGIDIRTGVQAPDSPARPDTLGLGRRTTVAGARQTLAFPVAVPAAPGFAQPDRVHVDEAVPSGGRVTLLYEPRPGLPEVGGTGVGMLITQFRAHVDENFMRKLVASEASVVPVGVGTARGYWISGPPHVVFYVDAQGRSREDTLRLAANTLMWERDGITFRLESALGRAESVGIARSLR